MDYRIKKALLEHLLLFVSDNKKELFQKNIADRTRYITVVLEDIYQPHNASAVLRTCDCFGIQDVHIIENRNAYRVNPDVALGSSKWLSIHKYNESDFNTTGCINRLKSEGYRIVATTPHKNDKEIQDLSLEGGKIALLFGTEKEGLTKEALSMADEYVIIPMYGFTESFNISVTAALCLFSLSNRIRESEIDWRLTESDSTDVLLDWARSVVKKPDLLEREFLSRYNGTAR
jgi:tRNA (guanosine-2'-O-)-methyltransferase